jgi:hypothetical protein
LRCDANVATTALPVCDARDLGLAVLLAVVAAVLARVVVVADVVVGLLHEPRRHLGRDLNAALLEHAPELARGEQAWWQMAHFSPAVHCKQDATHWTGM